MESGALSLTVVSFKIDVPLSGCAEKFRTSRGHWCYWGTSAIWGNLSFSPNNLTVSAAGKRTINPSRTRWCNSPRMNAVISGVHAEAWGPFTMARSRDLCSQAGPVCTGMPFSTHCWSRGAAECWTALGSAPRGLLCLEETKAVSEGDFLSASNVSQALAVISTALESTEGE